MTLDPTSFPAWLGRLQDAERGGLAGTAAPRRYPGQPAVPLPPVRRRWWTALDRTLTARRTRFPGVGQPTPRDLGRLLALSHGVTGEAWRGPVPSAGGLQALELYPVVVANGWLEPAAYHYDRAGHTLARVADAPWQEVRGEIPSLAALEGGAILWLIVGDAARARPKYGERADHFLALEAGHLMQNLCLVSASLGRTTVPLGGFFEAALARRLRLPATDLVLYAGLFG
ncbi:MAG: SagB/ThcOx family dehydrogenase [Gemmataceae bacterium]